MAAPQMLAQVFSHSSLRFYKLKTRNLFLFPLPSPPLVFYRAYGNSRESYPNKINTSNLDSGRFIEVIILRGMWGEVMIFFG